MGRSVGSSDLQGARESCQRVNNAAWDIEPVTAAFEVQYQILRADPMLHRCAYIDEMDCRRGRSAKMLFVVRIKST